MLDLEDPQGGEEEEDEEAAWPEDEAHEDSPLEDMDNIAIVAELMLELHNKKLIKLLRIKERFFEQPSSGGWRGKRSGVYGRCHGDDCAGLLDLVDQRPDHAGAHPPWQS